MAGLLIAVVYTVILASVPPVDRDALTHHLAVPKLYLQHGGMYEIPSVPFSYYPMNLDLLYLIPLALGNDILPKYLHFGFGLLTACLMYSYSRRRLESPSYGLLCAVLFLSLPVILKLSITVYVDLGLIFFSSAALLYLFNWVARGFALRHLITSGIFCGLALGTKYNGLITFFLLVCFVPIIYLRGIGAETTSGAAGGTSGARPEASSGFPALKGVGYGAVFAAVAMIVFSPWMIRNYVWTLNPVYPLYDHVFNARDPKGVSGGTEVQETRTETDESGLNHFTIRRLVFNESILETLTIPIRIFFQGEDDNPKYFDGRLNPYLFFFPILAFIGFRQLPRRLQNESIMLTAFSGLYLLFAFVQTDMRIRYVAPIIPPLTILSVLGVHNLIRLVKRKASSPAVGIGVVACIVGLFMVCNVQYALDQFHQVEPLEYLSGRISRDDYIQRFRPEYATYRYINQHLPQQARVLGVFLGDRRYYCDRELICDGTLEAGVRNMDSADALARLMRAKGFSHIMIRTDLFVHAVLGRLSADRVNLFQAYLSRYTRELFSESGYVLLEVSN